MSTLSPPPVSLLDRYFGQSFLSLYSTSVVVTGGEVRHARASGHAVSDDGALDVSLRLPKGLGGPGGGTNPEQLLAAGYAACFHGALSLIAAKRRIKLPESVTIKVRVSFGRDPADGLFLLTSDVEVTLPSMDAALADSLIAETELTCPYAKMARQGMQSSVRRVS